MNLMIAGVAAQVRVALRANPATHKLVELVRRVLLSVSACGSQGRRNGIPTRGTDCGRASLGPCLGQVLVSPLQSVQVVNFGCDGLSNE